MGISFGDLLREALTAGKANTSVDRKKKKKPAKADVGRAGDAIRSGDLPLAAIPNAVAQSPGIAALAPPPPPALPAVVAAPPIGSAAQRIIEATLASLPMPDPAAYSQPFDRAEQLARDALAHALPRIEGTYTQLRGDLGQNQAAYQQQAQQQLANQQQSQAANQQLFQQLTAPVAADLQAQGGNIAVGSLQGAQQAQLAAQQAQMAQQGAAQQQLNQNLSNVANQSFTNRVEDTRLAEQAARGNAEQNLNMLLNQIGVQRANAQRQYQSDLRGVEGQRLQLQMQLAQLADEQTQRQQALLDPARQLGQLQAVDQLAAYQQARNAPPAYQLLDTWRQRNPVATSLVENVFNQADDVNDAMAILSEMTRQQAKQTGGSYVKYQGKRISVGWVRSRLEELYGNAR